MRLATGFARLPSPASSPVGATWITTSAAKAGPAASICPVPPVSKASTVETRTPATRTLRRLLPKVNFQIFM
jgi:hypothetical protein